MFGVVNELGVLYDLMKIEIIKSSYIQIYKNNIKVI